MTSEPLIPRDEAARRFHVSARLLARYESRGLVHVEQYGEVVGYPPAEVRRLWTVVTLQRDLGINLAGVEAVLKLRSHLALVHEQIRLMTERLIAELDADDDVEPEDVA